MKILGIIMAINVIIIGVQKEYKHSFLFPILTI